MLNVHLSYKPPSSWRKLFWSGGRPKQFIFPKKIRSLVVPRGRCRKGMIIQGIQLNRRLSCGRWSCLRRKWYIREEYVHVPRKRNSPYIKMARWTTYETRQPKHPQSPIRQYEWRSQGLTNWHHYKGWQTTMIIGTEINDDGVASYYLKLNWGDYLSQSGGGKVLGGIIRKKGGEKEIVP